MSERAYEEAQCISACEHIAREIVRPFVRHYYRADGLPVFVKGDASVATEADRGIEAAIRAFLSERFPAFGVIGEELGADGVDCEYVWTIDPIDGTEAFVAGVPLFGTLLAVVRQDAHGHRVPVLGALYLPVQDELVIGNRARTTLNGRVVTMRDAAVVTQRRLILGDMAQMARCMSVEDRSKVLALAASFRAAQTWGDCLGYVNLLKRYAHARIEAALGVDDIAPIEPILLGAGGCVSEWGGASISDALTRLSDLGDTSASFTLVSAATPALHAELAAALW